MSDVRVMAMDWSGAKSGAEKRIWLAEARSGQIVRLEAGRSRDAIAQHLIELAASDPALVVGLDFAFSFPAWFLRTRAFDSARTLWQRARAGAAERWLDACEPPFWGKPGRARPYDGTDPLRISDRACKAKSVFQIGGAGAVGTASLRGMSVLHALREAGFRIWPFDDPGLPLALEIYPRLFTGPVAKSKGDARRRYVDEHLPHIDAPMRTLIASTEDAFDAAVSALAMDAHRDELLALPAIKHPQLRLEGAIWQPGWTEEALVG